MCRTMREIVIPVLNPEVGKAWEKLSRSQQEVIEETIIAMTKEPNCSPYRAMNTALDYAWPTRNQREINMKDILRALKRFNKHRAIDRDRQS